MVRGGQHAYAWLTAPYNLKRRILGGQPSEPDPVGERRHCWGLTERQSWCVSTKAFRGHCVPSDKPQPNKIKVVV